MAAASSRPRSWVVIVVVVVVVVVIIVASLFASGVLSSSSSPSSPSGSTPPPKQGGFKSFQLVSGQANLAAQYSVAEGDSTYQWSNAPGNPTDLWINWTTTFAASVCFLDSQAGVNYTVCDSEGGTLSAYVTSGSLEINIASAQFKSGSYSFVEQRGYTDEAYGSIWVRSTGGGVGESGQLAVITSLPVQQVWYSDTFPLPTDESAFEIWFNASSEGSLEDLSLSASNGAYCLSGDSSVSNYPDWTCSATYTDEGPLSVQITASYTAALDMTASYVIWVT